MATNYTGGLIINDIEKLHSTPSSKEHFESFKKYLNGKGIEWESFPKSSAHILKIKKNYYVYFTGGTTWWGYQKNAIKKMIDESGDDSHCILLIYADVEDKHYWWIKLDKTNLQLEESGRWLFSESSKDRIVCPKGFNDVPEKISEDGIANMLNG